MSVNMAFIERTANTAKNIMAIIGLLMFGLSVISASVSVLGALLYKANAEAIWDHVRSEIGIDKDFTDAITTAVSDNATAIAANAEAIRKSGLPTHFFDLSPRSGPTMGPCIEGIECEVRVILRRTAEAMSCDLVTDGVVYYYMDFDTQERHDLTMFSEPPRNVGTSWVNMDFTFRTPRGLSPESDLCTEQPYINCNGQTPQDGEIGQGPQCVTIPITMDHLE